MLVEPDSPLRRIPQGLDRRQLLVIDGVRVAAEIIDLATTRLNSALLALPLLTPHTIEYFQHALTAVNDAWSIVDNTHRLCELLRQFPRAKQSLPQFQILYRSTARAETLRHYIQHVRREIDGLAGQGASVWGTLTWCLKSDFDAGTQKRYALHMGSFYQGAMTAIGQFPTEARSEVDHITIFAGKTSLSISGISKPIEQIIRGLEHNIEDQAGHLPRESSDMLFALEFRRFDHQQASEPGQGGTDA